MHGSEDMDGAESAGVINLPAGTQTKQDLAYGPDHEQQLDVYLPAAPHNAPVLFMVHGGAWMMGDKRSAGFVTNKVGHWVPKGYIVVSVNYRMAAPDPLKQVADVASALAYAQAQAPSWGGDPARFLVMGHSAGAHLVALLASDPAIAKAAGAKPWLGTVALDSAAYDLPQIMNARHFRFYDRVFKDDPTYWQQNSPIHRLNTAPQPFLAICSNERRISCPQAEAFVRKVTSLGGKAQVVPIAKSHQELNKELGQAGPYTDVIVNFMRSLGLP